MGETRGAAPASKEADRRLQRKGGDQKGRRGRNVPCGESGNDYWEAVKSTETCGLKRKEKEKKR